MSQTLKNPFVEKDRSTPLVQVNTIQKESQSDIDTLQYKIVLVGDSAVGKTSLVTRLCTEGFAQEYKPTVGLDLYKKTIELPNKVNACLQIWDIGGDTLSSSMLNNYLYAAQAIIFVYDITNAKSFANLGLWLEEVKKTFEDVDMPYLALVGNKMDVTHLRTVKPMSHSSFADANHMFSFLISARLGDLVSVMFRRVAADLSGVVLSRSDLEAGSVVIPARIVNHQQHDPSQEQVVLPSSSICSIQ